MFMPDCGHSLHREPFEGEAVLPETLLIPTVEGLVQETLAEPTCVSQHCAGC